MDTAQTTASNLMSQSFMPIFGNMNFQIAPSMSGEVRNTFGVVPYLSLETLIYQQQISAQVSPVNVVSGQNSGQQNIQGSYTIQDSNGLTRMVMGFVPNGF